MNYLEYFGVDPGSPPVRPGVCIVIHDPNGVAGDMPIDQCGEATTGRTVLEAPICDDCYQEVAL